jgi:hypothetical protein
VSADAPGTAERLVLVLTWSLGLVGAILEILLALIWIAGDVVAVFGPVDPARIAMIRLSGVVLLIVSTLIAIGLLRRIRSVWAFRLERQGARDTARFLLILTVPLLALGLAIDVARGDGKPFLTALLGVLDAPSFIAAILIFIDPRLTM